MKNARNAREYRQAADRLDLLEQNHHWKFEEDSDDCDMELIRQRLDKLKRANHAGDMEEMLSHIRNDLKRDLGAMCNVQLYLHCHTGTKFLIDEYTDVVKYTIERLMAHCETLDAPDVDRYLRLLKAARQSFGNTALMLSGGGTLGMCHIGVVKCLLDEGLLPRIVCGSSAGSIVGSVLCTQKPEIVAAKLDELTGGDLNVFQDDTEIQGIIGMGLNILSGEPGFRIKNLCRVMRNLLGDITFREAYNRTGMVLNIHVSCGDRHNLPRLLNHMTAPNVLVWTAVASSCSLPLVFKSGGLKEKNPETKEIDTWGHPDHEWIDGSIAGDLPADILERLFNVNNFIASQVNPHVIHFIPTEGAIRSVYRETVGAVLSNAMRGVAALSERFDDFGPLRMVHSIFSQSYTGDITILPNTRFAPATKILANPDEAFMKKAVRSGEEATWPKIDRIKNMVAIELALDRAIKHVQGVKVGSSAPGLRRTNSTRSEAGFTRRRSATNRDTSSSFTTSRGSPTSRIRTHRPSRSMVEPPSRPLTQAMTGTHSPTEFHLSSSSDEMPSGYSSPVTSYNDEDFSDLSDRPSPGMNIDDAERARLAFMSQPASPSISYKAYFLAEESGIQPPSSPELRRVFNELHMSAIELPKGRRKSSIGAE
jgi:TAG lipase/steryl ester hydrolase/phospholipase A2/LPA acyltransferase